MNLRRLWPKYRAPETPLQRALVGRAETIADVASVNQAALAEINSLHVYAAQQVAAALALASSLGVAMEDREDRRYFWLTYFIDHTPRVVQGAEEEISQTLKFYARLTQDIVRWKCF